MSKILMSTKWEIRKGEFGVKFQCPEVANIDFDKPVYLRTRNESDLIQDVTDRIDIALKKIGWQWKGINFRNMLITISKID